MDIYKEMVLALPDVFWEEFFNSNHRIGYCAPSPWYSSECSIKCPMIENCKIRIRLDQLVKMLEGVPWNLSSTGKIYNCWKTPRIYEEGKAFEEALLKFIMSVKWELRWINSLKGAWIKNNSPTALFMDDGG